MAQSAMLLFFRHPGMNRLAEGASAFALVTLQAEADEITADAEEEGYVLETTIRIQALDRGDFDDASTALGKLIKVGIL